MSKKKRPQDWRDLLDILRRTPAVIFLGYSSFELGSFLDRVTEISAIRAYGIGIAVFVVSVQRIVPFWRSPPSPDLKLLCWLVLAINPFLQAAFILARKAIAASPGTSALELLIATVDDNIGLWLIYSGLIILFDILAHRTSDPSDSDYYPTIEDDISPPPSPVIDIEATPAPADPVDRKDEAALSGPEAPEKTKKSWRHYVRWALEAYRNLL